MLRHRLTYFTVLIGAVVFYWAYREWLSWLLLVGLLALPWLSLLLSLPAVLTCKVQITCPTTAQQREQVVAEYMGSCPLPIPAVRARLRAANSLTGQQWLLRGDLEIPTRHCGAVTVQPARVWVHDYLGLFRLPVKNRQGHTLLVRPRPVALESPPDVNRYLAATWRPKPGGGFAENHELRLYRPGDSLRQVHWKLSAKTGKLMLREPMVPLRGKALLTLALRGTPAQLDRKLGQLLWLSRYLTDKGVPHEIHCLTGSGMEVYPVASGEDALAAVDALLAAKPGAGESEGFTDASWRYHIGGNGHEE